MLNIRLASATAFALSLSSPLSMADDASAAGAQRRVKAAKGTKAAKGIKGGAAAVNGGKSAKGDRQRGKLLQCGREILGTHIYGGSCGNTFAVTIGCEDDESLGGCHYREVSVRPLSLNWASLHDPGSDPATITPIGIIITNLSPFPPFSDKSPARRIDLPRCMLSVQHDGLIVRKSQYV